jgi:hypothetical protein
MVLRSFERASNKADTRRVLRRLDSLMKRPVLIFLPFVFLLNACGAPAMPATEAPAAPALPFVVTITTEAEAPAATEPVETETVLPETTVTETSLTPLETATETLPSPTATASLTFTPAGPTPTETLLPPLELPTEKRNAPALVPWTGLPTYPADSDPGLLFRVDYDPDVWAQTEGNFGDIVLGNRNIEYCTITPWEGRGLPPDWKVEHDFRYIGSAGFDVSVVTYQGETKFVTYVGGDRHVLTGFQVTFTDQREQCLQDAEAVFGTLRSLVAVPTITPTSTPETPTPISTEEDLTATPTP